MSQKTSPLPHSHFQETAARNVRVGALVTHDDNSRLIESYSFYHAAALLLAKDVGILSVA